MGSRKSDVDDEGTHRHTNEAQYGSDDLMDRGWSHEVDESVMKDEMR